MLVLEGVPDFLPQASGLLTAVPQTPLAHLHVLARNRGIPNAYLGGVLDDPNIDPLARVRAPVVGLRADAAYALRRGEASHEGTWSSCEVEVMFSTPEAFLRSLLEAHESASPAASP